MMKKGDFTFKGRFTLREINGTWSIYDRETNGLVPQSPTEHTFTKATQMLIDYKKKMNDVV
jgi:hypothetical protein